jgi:uncharacterized membrane protein
MTDNAAAALCYALGLITGVLFLVLAPYNQNRTVRFHAFQSIFLSVAAIIGSIAVGIFVGLLYPIIGWPATSLWWAYRLLCFILWILMLVTTYQGKPIQLPVIGPMAQQQAGA